MKIDSCYLYRTIFGMMFFLILSAFITGLYVFVTESYGTFWAYSSFEVSDWLINYEGGFVRRGLIGQLLFFLYQIHPYPVRFAILFICVLGFVTICWLLIRILKKEGMSIFILPFSICLYYSFACDLLWTRRDYWALIIALGIYYSYFKLLRTPILKWYFLFFTLSAVTLLMHEASFFFTFPIMIVHGCCNIISGVRKNKKKAFARLAVMWIPVLVLFLLICIHKGNANIMESIWKSWDPCFEAYPMKSGKYPQMGIGVGFLRMTSFDAIWLHIKLVWLNVFAPYVPSLPFTLFMIVCTYYLVTRLNTVDLKLYDLKNVDNNLLSNILIIQFIFLFPMFGFLSCDLGRVIPYWVISSLMMYYVVKQNQNGSFMVPNFLNQLSIKVQGRIDSIGILQKPWVYCCLILFLPLNSYYGASYMGMIPVQFFLKAMKVLGL